MLGVENDQRQQLIAVTIAGQRFNEEELHALWLLLSFVTGTRAQPTVIEHFDSDAVPCGIEYLGAVEYGPTGTRPPFDLRIAHTTFDPRTFTVLADGFARLEKAGFPVAIALHHLFDANSSFTQVEIKNLLFCIHTLFEAWTEQNGQREIELTLPR